jgi:hypothetical protein
VLEVLSLGDRVIRCRAPFDLPKKIESIAYFGFKPSELCFHKDVVAVSLKRPPRKPGRRSLLPHWRALASTSQSLDPVRALFWSINGVVAPPLMAMMMLISSNKEIMGRFTVRGGRRIAGSFATVVMAAAAIGMATAAMSSARNLEFSVFTMPESGNRWAIANHFARRGIRHAAEEASNVEHVQNLFWVSESPRTLMAFAKANKGSKVIRCPQV